MPICFIYWSKCFCASLILFLITAGCTVSSDVMTIINVFVVNSSINAVKFELRTRMAEKPSPLPTVPGANCDCILLQLNLNCLIILLIFSKRWTSRCSFVLACALFCLLLPRPALRVGWVWYAVRLSWWGHSLLGSQFQVYPSFSFVPPSLRIVSERLCAHLCSLHGSRS